jgi:TolB-like protein/Tfp pilus assembly protein PilF
LKLLVSGASLPTTLISKKSNSIKSYALLLLLIVGAIVFVLYRRPSAQITSIAVLPFSNVTGDSDTEYLSDGISETIINRLSQLSNLKVASRTSAFRYRSPEPDLKEISKELNVRAILVGRVQQRGESISVSAELIDTKDNSQLWGDQYNTKLSDLLSVQNSISQEISESLKIKLTGSQRTKLTKQETTNPEAYQLYLKGRYHFYKFTEDGLTKSIPYYEQAIAKDPSYALAYSGLAGAYSVLAINYWRPADAFPKAKAAAAKAIQLDDSIGSIHNMLGVGRLFFDWDWPGAKREFDRAQELDPGLADVHNLLAYYWIVTGNPEEGIRELKRGLELEPLLVVLNTDLAFAYTVVSKNDDAIRECRTTLEMDPQYSIGYVVMGIAYADKGMFPEAIAALEKARSLEQNAEILGRLGNAYARAGDTQRARAVLNELMSLSLKKYIAPFGAAMIYTGLGENGLALEWLEKSYQERSPWLIWIGADPVFLPLHKEPGFQQILSKMHLPAYEPQKGK